MKTLTKRLAAFFVALCMITPLFGQSAWAANSVPQNFESDVMSIEAEFITAEEADILSETNSDPDAGAYATPSGTRVLNITIYPLGINLDTGKTITGPSIYKRVSFISSGQSEGLYLTTAQTADLTKQMANYLKTLGGNYDLYGWRIAGTVTFTYDKLRYLTYQSETISYKSNETTVNLSGSSITYPFSADIPYPSGVDLDNDYYYARIRGACYFQTSSGGQSDALFLIAGGFND